MTKTEEIIVTNAIETNIFTESISEVRFVKSFEGFDFRIKYNSGAIFYQKVLYVNPLQLFQMYKSEVYSEGK